MIGDQLVIRSRIARCYILSIGVDYFLRFWSRKCGFDTWFLKFGCRCHSSPKSFKSGVWPRLSKSTVTDRRVKRNGEISRRQKGWRVGVTDEVLQCNAESWNAYY